MDARTTKKGKGSKDPLIDRAARLAARKRVVGIWKDRYKEMIKENRVIRKEWDKRVKKLGW